MDWEVHDRISLTMIKSNIEKVSEEQLLIEEKIILDKANARTQDRFTSNFKFGVLQSHKKDLFPKGRKVAVLFTNSPDELVGLNPQYYPARDMDQYDELCLVAERLKRLEYDLIVRVHPNIVNKSQTELRRVRDFWSAFRRTYYFTII